MLLLLLFCVVVPHPAHPLLIQSLHGVLDYGFINRIKDLNFLFGVAIAKGQLSVTKDHLVGDDNLTSELAIIIQKCDILLEFRNETDDPLAQALSPHLWTQDFTRRPLSTAPLRPSYFHLPPPQSNSCIRFILSSCSIPEECVRAEFEDMVNEYSLTHQVIYWTLFGKVCKRNFMLLDGFTRIKHKCGRILNEHINILEMGLPDILRDLYFEQVVVCGLHGYLPFLSRSHQRELLSLQTPEGCFALSNSREQQLCDDHLTGVATAAAAVLLRHGLMH